MGKNLDPDDVSRRLALVPGDSHRSGDPHLGKAGRRYADFSEGLWALSSSLVETASLEEHLGDIISRVGPKSDVLRELRLLGFRTDVFVGVFGQGGNSGFSISSATLAALGELGLTLEVDIYA